MMDPLGGNLSRIANQAHLLSARPDAPVVPDRAPRSRRQRRHRHPGLVRRATAHGLRRLADRLEPGPAGASS